MKKTVVFICLLLLSTDIKSQNSFSLEDAINYALKNNRSAKNATNDLKIANAKKWETIATGLPQISAFFDYSNNIKQPISLVPAEFFWRKSWRVCRVVLWNKTNVRWLTHS